VTTITYFLNLGHNEHIITLMDTKIVEILDKFFERYPSQEFGKGDILISAGDEPKGIFYLRSGNVRQYVINKNGEEMTLNIYKPNTFFPMAWALNAYSNSYYFEVMNDIEVCVAPKKQVVIFVKREPKVLFDLLKRVYIGLDGVLSRLEFLMSGTARQKLITILVISAKRFGEVKKGYIVIILKLTHQDLASLAGLSRETVSREMMSLKKNRLMDYTSTSITVYNIGDLENELVE